MDDILRLIGGALCRPIYKLIPKVYAIFYNLANARFFTDETISSLSKNLYILISVVMLFTFSATLLSAIVNPDILSDKKKGPGAVVKRSIIGIILIVIIPFAFDEAYKIQQKIMCNSLIEKIIVGITFDSQSDATTCTDSSGNCCDDECAKGGNGGQVIAGTLISSVLYPINDNVEVKGVSDAGEVYESMVTKNIEDIKKMTKKKYLNAAPNNSSEEYAFEFEGLIAIIAGGATVYILILYAMDTAVRMFKLAFFELTAPISIIAYVAAGPDSLKRWATEVGKTYVEVFVRVAGMAIYLFLMQHLDDFYKNVCNPNFFFKVLLVVGMLIFIKQLPDIVNRTFGTNWQTKGGIGGRLGSMAAVGDVAKNAWDKVKKGLTTAGLTLAAGTAALSSLPAALGSAFIGGTAWAAGHQWKKGFNGTTPWKDTKGGRGITTGLKTAGAFLGSGNPLKGISAAGKVLEESEGGKQRQTERLQSQQNKRAQSFRDRVNAEARRLDPNLKEDVITKDKDGNIHFSNGMLAQKALQNVIENDKSLTKQQRDNARALFRENGRLETLNGLKDQKQKLLDEISNSQNALNPNASDYKARYDALEALKGNILNGNATATEIDAKIKNLYGDGTITGVAADNMGSALSKIMNAITFSNLSADVKGKLTSKDGKEALNLSNSVLLSSITDQNKVIAGVKSDYDQSKEGATTLAKEMLNRYETASDTINNKAMFQEQGQQEGPDGKKTGYAYKYSQTTTAGPTAQPANDPLYGMPQAAYDEIISEGYTAGTPDFHARASSVAGYNGKGGMSTSSTYGMSQAAYDEIVSEGYEPGTSDFHERASGISGYNGLGASGVYTTSQPQQTTTTSPENNSGTTIINNYGTGTNGGGATAQVNVDMSGVESAMKEAGNKMADATKKAMADSTSTITSKLDELHTTMKSSANLEARRDAKQMNQETKIIVDADGNPISSDSDK